MLAPNPPAILLAALGFCTPWFDEDDGSLWTPVQLIYGDGRTVIHRAYSSDQLETLVGSCHPDYQVLLSVDDF